MSDIMPLMVNGKALVPPKHRQRIGPASPFYWRGMEIRPLSDLYSDDTDPTPRNEPHPKDDKSTTTNNSKVSKIPPRVIRKDSPSTREPTLVFLKPDTPSTSRDGRSQRGSTTCSRSREKQWYRNLSRRSCDSRPVSTFSYDSRCSVSRGIPSGGDSKRVVSSANDSTRVLSSKTDSRPCLLARSSSRPILSSKSDSTRPTTCSVMHYSDSGCFSDSRVSRRHSDSLYSRPISLDISTNNMADVSPRPTSSGFKSTEKNLGEDGGRGHEKEGLRYLLRRRSIRLSLAVVKDSAMWWPVLSIRPKLTRWEVHI